MARKIAGVLAGLIVCTGPASAQQAPPPAPTITPEQGQTPEKLQLDQAECTNAATQATGHVPGAEPPPPPAAQGPSGARVRGAARGAATGAVVGEVQGDRYENAPDEIRDEHTRNQAQAGAVAGVVAGGSRARQGRRQAAAQQKTATEQYESAQAAWQNSYAACLQQRGYSVSAPG